MRDDFSQLLDIRRLQIDQLVGQILILQIPQVDAKIVGGEKALSIVAHAQ